MLDLVLKVDTKITANNLDEYADEIKKQVDAVSTDLQTDDDFAEAETLVKSFKKSEDALLAAKENIFEQGDLRKINDTITELHSTVREKRLVLNRLVTKEKAVKKKNLIDDAFTAVDKVYIEAKWSKHIALPSFSEFEDQVKGKKKFDAMENALNRFVGLQIQAIHNQEDALNKKAIELGAMIEGFEHLFDMNTLLGYEDKAEEFIVARIEKHNAEIDAAAKAKAQEMSKQVESKQDEIKEQAAKSIDPPIPTINSELNNQSSSGEPVNDYVIRISMQVTQTKAVEIARDFADIYSRENVQLTKLGEVA